MLRPRFVSGDSSIKLKSTLGMVQDDRGTGLQCSIATALSRD